MLSVEALPLAEAAAPKASRFHSRRFTPKVAIRAKAITLQPTSTVEGRPFNVNTAQNALEMASWGARACTRSEVSGTVVATFEPSGNVQSVSVKSISGDTTGKDCLVQAFRRAKGAPFGGHRATVSKSFRVSR